MQTTPIAKPTGHKLGGGRCGLPWPCWGSTLERLPFPAHLVGFNRLGAPRVNDVTNGAKCVAFFRSPSRCLRPSLCSGEIKCSLARTCAVLFLIGADPVLGPAAVDELPDVFAHPNLLGPRPRALLGALRGCVDAQLAAEELVRRRVVQ